MSEGVSRASKRTSEWPSIPICILGHSGPQWDRTFISLPRDKKRKERWRLNASGDLLIMRMLFLRFGDNVLIAIAVLRCFPGCTDRDKISPVR